MSLISFPQEREREREKEGRDASSERNLKCTLENLKHSLCFCRRVCKSLRARAREKERAHRHNRYEQKKKERRRWKKQPRREQPRGD